MGYGFQGQGHFPIDGGQHYIRIKAKVCKETSTKIGDRIEVRITVLDRAQVDIPEDLINALRAEKAEESFKSLPPGKQTFMVRCINEVVKPQTREKRIQEALHPCEVRPNPSLKLSTNGLSRWSSGARPVADFAPATQRATALASA